MHNTLVAPGGLLFPHVALYKNRILIHGFKTWCDTNNAKVSLIDKYFKTWQTHTRNNQKIETTWQTKLIVIGFSLISGFHLILPFIIIYFEESDN